MVVNGKNKNLLDPVWIIPWNAHKQKLMKNKIVMGHNQNAYTLNILISDIVSLNAHLRPLTET